ncbi:MAG TPA: SPOR domain-containing protein [Bryobacteraceae bacterium]|nr:SPOR domain-containing protein [Bryobacteraceae bacterium]
MARTDDGEFEFVVGNRHLLSAVFVLMVLFGIFFSLGYFVGRSGDGTSAPTQASASTGGGVRQPQDAPAPAMETAVAPGEAQVAQPAEGTQAVAAEPVAGEQPLPDAGTPAPEPARPAVATGPQPGETFLQVAAVKHSEAKVIVDVLRAKGFSAVTAPVVINGVVSDSLYRALVGPVKDAGDLARLKSDLQAAGFKPYVQKY